MQSFQENESGETKMDLVKEDVQEVGAREDEVYGESVERRSQKEEDCPHLNPGAPHSDSLLLPQPPPSFPSFCSSSPVVFPSVSASPARDESYSWRHLVQHSNVLKDIETRSAN